MSQARVQPAKPRRSRPERPAKIKNEQGWPFNYRKLIETLRDQLDLGHPESPEVVEDILRVARELNRIRIPVTSHRLVIQQVTALDGSRDVLGNDELQDKLHELLQRLIRRLQHTHPRRPKPMKLPTADKIPPPRRRRR
jgi:hypothetical protein